MLLSSSSGDYRTAEVRALALKERHGESPVYRAMASEQLGGIASVRGRLADAEQYYRDAMNAYAETGNRAAYVIGAVSLTWLDVGIRHRTRHALDGVESALLRFPLDSMNPLDRPYLSLAIIYALSDKPQRARTMLAEYERVVPPALLRGDEPWLRSSKGYLAIAEGRTGDAIREFQAYASGAGSCTLCGLPELGRAYDRAGDTDSVIAVYERYVNTPELIRLDKDAIELPAIYERLGELHEQRGEFPKAVDYYTRFVNLWHDCDAELRPRVADVRRRLAELAKNEPG